MPILRAVPAIVLIACSILLVFKSDSLSLAISSTCFLVTLPIVSLPLVPEALAKFAALFTTLMKGQMRMDDASVAEFLKIKGFQIATEMNAEIMGGKIHSTSEVLEIAQKPAPAGVYSAPKGYAKKDTLSMEELQKH